jgi:hypothetical protein
LIRESAVAFGRGDAQNPKAEDLTDEIAKGIEVGALGATPAYEWEVSAGLGRPVSVARVPPLFDQPPIALDVETHIGLSRVEIERKKTVGREMLDLIDLDGECIVVEHEVDPWITPSSFPCEESLVPAERVVDIRNRGRVIAIELVGDVSVEVASVRKPGD